MERYILVDTMSQHPLELKNYPEAQDDTELVRLAVKKNGLALEYASERLRDDYETVMIAVKKEGLSLKFASSILQHNKEIVSAAISCNGHALKYVPEALRHDRELVLLASSYCYAEFIPEEFLSDKEIAMNLIQCDEDAYLRISDELACDLDIVLAAINKYARHDYLKIMMNIPDAVWVDKEKVLKIVEIVGEAVAFASDELKKDKEIALVSLKSAIRNYNKIISCEELGFCVPDFSYELWTDPDIRELLAEYVSYTENYDFSIPPTLRAHIAAGNFSTADFEEQVSLLLDENGIHHEYMCVDQERCYICDIVCDLDYSQYKEIKAWHLDEDSAWEYLIEELNEEFGDPT